MMKRCMILLVYFLVGCFLYLCPIADFVNLPRDLRTEAIAQSSNPDLSGTNSSPSGKEINTENPVVKSDLDKYDAFIKESNRLSEQQNELDNMYNFKAENIPNNLSFNEKTKKYDDAWQRKIAVGKAFLKKGKRKEAIKEFYKILIKYNDNISSLRIIVFYQLNYPQFKKDLIPLLEDYRKYLEKNSAPNERLAQCFSNLSSAYQDDNQHDKAIGMAHKSLELLSKNILATAWQITSAKERIGRCYLKAKRFREALPYLEEADEFFSALAIRFMRMNDINMSDYSINSFSCSAKENLYEAYIGQGMKEKAIRALAAISIPAKLPEINEALIAQYYRNCQDSFCKLANIYLGDKNYSEAINTLSPLLNHVKDSSYAYFLRYIAFDREKDFESAKEDLLKVIDLDGKTVTASSYVMLGDLYLDLRQYDDAEKAYKDALKIEPNNPSALHNLGVCFGSQGQKTMAADYYYRAGIIYLKNNKRDSALLALDNLKKIDSQFYDKLFFAIYKEKPSKERSKDKEKN